MVLFELKFKLRQIENWDLSYRSSFFCPHWFRVFFWGFTFTPFSYVFFFSLLLLSCLNVRKKEVSNLRPSSAAEFNANLRHKAILVRISRVSVVLS